MQFRYRFVNFGTSFSVARGNRASQAGQERPAFLYENELAVDVGGITWGYGDEQQSVLDHHSVRPNQFPSASAAVLHNVRRIHEKFGKSDSDVIWLVTHRQPDFDAFCSTYLARSILCDQSTFEHGSALGLDPSGWRQGDRSQIDWLRDILSAAFG